ncbi:MAG: replication endonuclease [Parashewanella sp.]
MDLNKLGKKAGINFSAIFSQNPADLEFAQHQLNKLPNELAAVLLCELAKNYQGSSQTKAKTLMHSFKVKTDNLKADVKWMQLQLDKLPDDVAATLQNQYIYKRKGKNTGRSANIWLRRRVEALHKMVKQFPLPIILINNEVKRANVAKEWADRCNSVLNNMTEFGNKQVDALELLTAVKEPADQWDFCPALPSFDDYQLNKSMGVFDKNPTMYNLICGAIARLVDDQWWARQLEKSFRQYKEHAAIIIGKVRAGVSPYVSNKTLLDYQSRKKANSLWLKSMLIVNEQHGFELSLADAVASSVSNPVIRRTELMVRMRGFEDMANKNGYVGEFYTWTAPSKFHSWKKSKTGKPYSNKKYQGANPRNTQAYLCKQWAKARAKLARQGVELFGFRVVEPHHDGTPHWHLLLFFKPEQVREARSIMRKYALQHDKHDLAPAKGKKSPNHQGYRPRFDFKTIDPEKGSATGYIAKYIAKNIDGAYVADDYEAECGGKHGAEGVAAWASTWNIRQFQQIGGASVSVWRELRRLKQAVVNDETLERARKSADAANWESYTEAMGGTFCKRADRPVQLAKLVNEAANQYGEDITKIMGVMATATAKTRLEGWEIRTPSNCPSQQPQPSPEDAAFAVALASKSGDNRAPWSTYNNCTETIKDQKRDQNLSFSDQQLVRECKKLGLDEFFATRLRAGAVINNVVNGHDQFIRLRDGMLLVSKKPFDNRNDFEDSALNSTIDAIDNAYVASIEKQLRAQAWRVFETNQDIELWLSQLAPEQIKPALKQFEEIIELHKREKYAFPNWRETDKKTELDWECVDGQGLPNTTLQNSDKDYSNYELF